MSSATDWLGLLSQRNRLLAIDTVLTDALRVERFHGREAVSTDFELVIDCLSTSAFIDLKPLIGTLATLQLANADGSTRSWQGYVTQAMQLGADGGLARYRLTLQSWLAFLAMRRNGLIFQDKDVRGILEQVFADYPEARWRMDVTDTLRTRPICTQYRESDADFVTRLLGEEGLAYRFEHDQGAALGDGGNSSGQSGPTLVIFDRQAARVDGSPASMPFARIDAAAEVDAITQLADRRQITSDSAVSASWRADSLQSVSGSASASGGDDQPSLPSLERWDADRSGRFDDSSQAERRAGLQLDSLRLPAHVYVGAGAVRTLEAGKQYTVSGHPSLSGQALVPLVIEHEAANNLGSDLTRLLNATELDAGSYRQRFLAVPTDTPIVPRHRDRPIAPGVQVATVVGVPDTTLTSTRDHQVRVQFPWQRGESPLTGGLTDTASLGTPAGHAPGDDRSGTWVRIAEGGAGANHGHSFVPRVGTEVLIGYAHGDIDQPVLLGQLYHGQAAPPFAAGVDAPANHPGTLSGIHTQTADGQPGSRWVLDDAPGQLSHTLSNSVANSRLSMGYLVDTPDASRGAYRGEGFELATEGWGVVRAGEGLLVSSSARAEATSTQMDIGDTTAQMAAAKDTAKRLDDASQQAKAAPLAGNPAQLDFQRGVDPTQDGRFADATKPTATARDGGDPVERFADPHVLFEAPSTVAFTSAKSAVAFASGQMHMTSQTDTHMAAGASVAAVTGGNVSLFTADGGFKAIAQHGPVSMQAHVEHMQILADQSVSVSSSTDRIDILAKDKIVLQAGQATVTLEGANITFACPGQFTVKAGQHPFEGPQSETPALAALPDTALAKETLYLDHRYHDDQGLAGAPYFATLIDGSTKQGTLDGQGRATIPNVPAGGAQVTFGPMPGTFERKDTTPTPGYDPDPSDDKLAGLVDKYYQPSSSTASTDTSSSA